MTLQRMARTRLLTAFLLFLVLGSGFILGAAVDRRLKAEAALADTAGAAAEAAPESGEDRSRSSSRRRTTLVEQVGLSEVQKARVDSLVGEFRTNIRSLHRELGETYDARSTEILMDTRDKIKAILTPQQRTAYDSLLAESDRRAEERRRESGAGSGSQRNRD